MNSFVHTIQRSCPLVGREVTLEALVVVECGCSCAISNHYDSFTCGEMDACPHYKKGNPACPVFTEQENAIER